MANLIIRNFSCIDHAELSLGRLTLFIGPQGSGKSIICKLIHYFFDISTIAFRLIEEGEDFLELQNKMIDIFKSKFPQSAWGDRVFQVEFTSGDIGISVIRTRASKGLSKNVRIKFSDNFINNYNEILSAFSAQKESRAPKNDLFGSPMEREEWWKFRRAAQAKWSNFFGREWSANQTFIPAGRAFFTTLGKAVAAFEQGGMLDDITIRFGRLFIALRDETPLYARQRNVLGVRPDVEKSLFGGKINLDSKAPHVEATDGRKIPLSIMSSGQQELLPLWIVMSYLYELEREGAVVYIEEPEAHLFPTSQSVLVEYLSTFVANTQGRRMIITTHSPYVLTKFNNLIQAGKLYALGIRSIDAAVSKIIPKNAALRPDYVKAYAIVNREVKNISDDDGLINGEYLDEVSNFLGEEYSRLLEAEPL